MDSDFWVSRLAAAKRQFINHHNIHLNSQLDRMNVDELDEEEEEEEEEDEIEHPCPYCYAEFDLHSLCSHLEDEHSDESSLAVCTICAARISRDMLRHITVEHESLFKVPRSRSRSRNVAIPRSQALSVLGRDLREAHLQMLLAGSGQRSSTGTTDPLLSSLVLNYPAPGAEEISKVVNSCAEDLSGKSVPAQHIWKSSFDPSLSSEEREKRITEAAGKAVFMQDLMCSTMLSD